LIKSGAAISLEVELVTSLQNLQALRADYDRLNRLALNTLPFALHDWHVTWCRHFLSFSGPIRDELRICVVRDGSGTCVAIVPLLLTRRLVLGLEVRALGLLGRDRGITEILGPLVQPGLEAHVAQAVQMKIRAMGKWDWTEWSGGDGKFRDALAAAAPLEWQRPLINHVIDLPATWELLHSRLKRNIRSSLRHCYNSLKREGLTFEFVVSAEREAVGEALERFFHLHARRAELTRTVPHANVFADERSRRFLREVCSALAERSIVRIFELRIGTEIVASRVGFIVGGTLYLYYSGFEPAWARYSVMTTTVAEAIKYAIAQRLRWVSLSPGTDVSKTRWGPRPMRFWQAAQIAPRWRSKAARVCYQYGREGSGLLRFLSPLLTSFRRSWG
jgi:CelD/BcsL family acetyltransferase involved in cellulose biosynthesis